jgi:polyhydroxyalkanoate synthesis regulator phasin
MRRSSSSWRAICSANGHSDQSRRGNRPFVETNDDNELVEDRSELRQQIEEMRSTLAQKGALTAEETHNTLDKLVQVAQKLASGLSDIDRALQAVEELRSQVGDIENRLKRIEDEPGKPSP